MCCLNKKAFKLILLFFLILGLEQGQVFAQNLPAGFPMLEEALRRKQLLGDSSITHSFNLRPLNLLDQQKFINLQKNQDSLFNTPKSNKHFQFYPTPILNTTVYNYNRPYGYGNYAINHGVGLQNLTSAGFFAKLWILEVNLRPEIVYSQNRGYRGFSGQFSDNVISQRFRYWNFGDHPERFDAQYNRVAHLGQSSVSLHAGPVELGVGTQNIWWGPGQFNSLIFSNNARGIEHLFLRTSRPVDIWIGKFEGQIIAGRAEESGIMPAQNQRINAIFGDPLSGDWRYINGFTFSFEPAFLPNFHLGINRTFQQFSDQLVPGLAGYLPIFEPFVKESLFENGNTVRYDALGQDQQASIFARFFSPKGNFEIYAEYGRRDHSFNWRDFILNPEHARAYLMGFSKLVRTGKPGRYLQFRGEIVHQQESINRYVRYGEENPLSTSWHTHYQARGFTNYGQSMGVGIGVGANSQTLEIGLVDNLNKFAFVFERIENQQDFYYLAFGEQGNVKPWVDLSLGIEFNRQFKNFVVGTSNKLVGSSNYQWQHTKTRIGSFEKSNQQKRVSLFSQMHLIYLFNNSRK